MKPERRWSFWFFYLTKDTAIRVPRKLLYFLPVHQRIHASPDYDGRGVTIAFVDSGFFPHPDLRFPRNRIHALVDVTSQRWTTPEFSRVSTSSWHGTMVACAACGRGLWSKGYYHGIASGAEMVLIKVFDGKKIRNRNIVRALEWIATHRSTHGIRVVNISVGGEHVESGATKRLCELIHELKSQRISVVVAAGNDPSRSMVPPARCSDAITVGGFNDNNSMDPKRFSEYGTTHGKDPDGSLKPDVVAPAYMLPVPMLPDNELFEESELLFELQSLSDKALTDRLKRRWPKTHLPKIIARRPAADIRKAIRQRMLEQKFFAPGHQHVDGTSFAAPMVSAVIAQMLEVNPTLTPELIKMILQQTATRIPHIGTERQGYGSIDGMACIKRAMEEKFLRPELGSPRVLHDRIVFFLKNDHAKRVMIVGDFTAWQRNVVQMRQVDRAVWRTDIPLLSMGDYRYKFLVDDVHWVTDPGNDRTENDEYGGRNSVFTVKRSDYES